jgi:hypothetical protein
MGVAAFGTQRERTWRRVSRRSFAHEELTSALFSEAALSAEATKGQEQTLAAAW